MSDKDVNTELRQIYIEMTKPKSWFSPLSWVIRFFQWKWWKNDKWKNVPSHTRIKFFDKYHGVWWIYEASGSAVKYIGDNQFAQKVHVVKTYEIYVPREIKKKGVVFVNQTTNMPYGKMQLIGLGLVKLANAFGLKISNPFADGIKRMVCAEAVLRFCEHIPGFKDKLDQYKPDSVDLCDIMDIFEEVL